MGLTCVIDVESGAHSFFSSDNDDNNDDDDDDDKDCPSSFSMFVWSPSCSTDMVVWLVLCWRGYIPRV